MPNTDDTGDNDFTHTHTLPAWLGFEGRTTVCGTFPSRGRGWPTDESASLCLRCSLRAQTPRYVIVLRPRDVSDWSTTTRCGQRGDMIGR